MSREVGQFFDGNMTASAGVTEFPLEFALLRQ
jgi:hypothetical protein